MKATTQNKGLQVEEGQTKLYVPHQNSTLTFIHPYHGPHTYANVASSIEQAGLSTPTLAETVSLVHAAFHSDDKYSTEIQQLMKSNWLWGFTGIHYVPHKGAYIQDHPSIKNGMLFMQESELVKKLEAQDPTVRHVPFGYKTESMSSLELAKNSFVQALAGAEGADKLAEIADKHKNKPYLYSLTSVNEPTTKASALYSDWGVGHWLDVVGYFRGGNGDGFAFGVRQ